eukprot:TRINITY_DN7857_c0_g1_i1.p1 TRINITY_DN7857_c0_g1~~TRINITY_DN7857_c0_g1_i1.p1  ORF type:complete len:686 (-),score=151.65 TRINITY_DN7857_c0_g1_i1:4-2031(-)
MPPSATTQSVESWITDNFSQEQATLLRDFFIQEKLTDLDTILSLDARLLKGVPLNIKAPILKQIKKQTPPKSALHPYLPTLNNNNDNFYNQIPQIPINNRRSTAMRNLGVNNGQPSSNQADFQVIEHENKCLIKIYSRSIRDAMRSSGLVTSEEIFDEEPVIEALELFHCLPQLRNNNVQGMPELVRCVEDHFAQMKSKIENMISLNQISYSSLWYLFPKDLRVCGIRRNRKQGAVVTSTKYLKGLFPCLIIDTKIIKSDGSTFFFSNETFTVPEYDGLIDISSLPLQPLEDRDYEELTGRGRIFSSLARGQHYKNYTGNFVYQKGIYLQEFRADGRVMVDGVNFAKSNAEYHVFRYNQNIRVRMGGSVPFPLGDNTNSSSTLQLPEEKWFMTWPTLPAFSFAVKKWGELFVENLREISFDDGAFHRLVLADTKKRLVAALVANSSAGFADIITGKGAGSILLLHGPPGTGKTLTAEALAELLHLPLYSVSVGELGTNTTELEKKLRFVLEVAADWKAVILLDEADIFLEKRSEKDIQRNAMVGIFLRLLEYHQGILFLTTNRVDCFDEAFHSRISISLFYPPHNQENRLKIWENLLTAAGIEFDSSDESNSDRISAKELAKYEINGRQIRSTIRLAQALAKAEGKEVATCHFKRTIEITEDFTEVLKFAKMENS